jgi:hypothetical protein
MVREVMALGLVLGVMACDESAQAPAKHPVKARAVFDMNCPAKELSFDKLDDDTLGVTGCGRRATYVRLCRDKVDQGASFMVGKQVTEEECKWVLNGGAQ